MSETPVPFNFEHKDIGYVEGIYFFDSSPHVSKSEFVENLVIRLSREDIPVSVWKNFFESENEIKKFVELQLKMRFIHNFQPDEFEVRLLTSATP